MIICVIYCEPLTHFSKRAKVKQTYDIRNCGNYWGYGKFIAFGCKWTLLADMIENYRCTSAYVKPVGNAKHIGFVTSWII